MAATKGIHVLSIDNVPIGMQYAKKRYLIGFGSANRARSVQYQMEMPVSKAFKLLPGVEPVKLVYDTSKTLIVDKDATLFVNKKSVKSKVQNNVMDHGVCLDRMDENDFLNLPFSGTFGVLLPTILMDETEEDMTFRCVTIDPVYDENEDIRESLRSIFQ